MSQAASVTDAGGRHVWEFFRAGGFDQVKLESGADLMALDQLDQKLWVALSCPTRGLEFDSRTLDLIDTDQDGRIRVPEVIAAGKWACANLRNPDDLVKGGDGLPLSAINDSTPEGKQLLASARQILTNLGRADAATITIEEAADTARIFAQTKFNGDGVVAADSARRHPGQGRPVLRRAPGLLGLAEEGRGRSGDHPAPRRCHRRRL